MRVCAMLLCDMCSVHHVIVLLHLCCAMCVYRAVSY